MPNVDYPHLLALFPEHLHPKRSESASFLIWYLENYYRLDTLEAVDAVCDQRGDKGVDGIFVNDNDETVTVFQAKINQSSNTSIGDKSLREFAGTLTQFTSAEKIQNLIDSAPNTQLVSLIKREEILNKINTHELRGEFLSNVDLDGNGADFLNSEPNITFVGKTILNTTYISNERNLPIHRPASFDVSGFQVTEYIVDATTKAVIAPIKATELVTLDGISDQTLFSFNVRGPLGKTKVNRQIRASISDNSRHKFFPLFHNGITVVAKTLKVNSGILSIEDYYVVNGCQSLSALSEDRSKLTDDLRILTKFVQLEPTSSWAKLVTEYSNTQNGVSARDFMSNNRIQIRLQNEFDRNYKDEFSFEIKRGENKGPGKVISNEDAGLLLMAFDLKEPWATHRKYKVFEEKSGDLFGRKEVTADRIVMCHVIEDAIKGFLPKINNQLVAKYKLTQYIILYVLRNILEKEPLYKEIIMRPGRFVRTQMARSHFHDCISRIIGDVIVDLNAEVDEFGEDFDYRDKLRNEDWVIAINKTIVAEYTKLINRHRIHSFSEEWAKADL
jgi:hypothetical protein